MHKVQGSPMGKVLNNLMSWRNNVSSLAGIDEREMEDISHAVRQMLKVWQG